MTNVELLILVVLFLVTSIVGVVTGSNSLVTVPVMFQFGMDEKVAVATNMFGLTFMAIGATIPFVRQKKIDMRGLSPLVAVTVAGSAMGAMLVGFIANASLKLIVSAAMIAVVIFTLFRRDPSASTERSFHPYIGYFAVFFLAIYGGLYSGGYVTLLTAAFVAFMGMTYSESIASTKFVNVFSSLVATLVFMWQHLVDYKIGLILGVTMFVGAFAGAHFASRMNDKLLKNVFLATVVLLAVKTLYDFF